MLSMLTFAQPSRIRKMASMQLHRETVIIVLKIAPRLEHIRL